MNENPLDLSHLSHRQLVGYLGLLLPIVVLALAAYRPTPPLPGDQLLGSISAYYYTGAVSYFVGILFALSLFLFTYRGYSASKADRVLGKIGGLCALCVAAFPTNEPAAELRLSWFKPVTPVIHYIAAIGLFLVFIAFAILLFRSAEKPGTSSPRRRLENRIYLGCGLVMIASLVWAGIAGYLERSIFWPEAIALWAFSISWLVKGQAPASIANLGRRISPMRRTR